MNDKHLKIEIESYKELVNINQKNIIKNAIVCISCGYLCLAFCFLYVSSVLKSDSILTILPIFLLVLCCIYTFKSYKGFKRSNINIKKYKNKLKSLNSVL